MSENENNIQAERNKPGKIVSSFNRVRNVARWFYRNFWKISISLLLILLLKYREISHPYIYASREYWAMILFTILAVFLVGFFFTRKFKKSESPFFRVLIFLSGIGVVAGSVYFRADQKLLNTYESVEKLKAVSTSIPVKYIDKPPITFDDRVYPLYLAKQDYEKEGQIGSSRELSMPCQVMLEDKRSYWAFLVTPNRWYQQWYCNVEEAIFIDVTEAKLKAKNEHIRKVSFDIAPNLAGSKNIITSTIRRFSFSMYFNYKPGQPRPMLDDNNEVVQVVPLSKLESMPGLTGKAYAYPVFGGVMVFEQDHIPFFSNPLGWLKRWLQRIAVGDGTFISPEEIKSGKYKYLLKQTLRPYEQMIYESKSFRYDDGIFGTLVHEDDVILEDPGPGRNPLPYVGGGDFRGTGADYLGRQLIMYSHLVTYGENNNVVYTLYKTADGMNDTLYVLDRAATGFPKYGLKRAATKIFDNQKAFRENENDALEHLDFVRDVLDENGDTIRMEYYYSTVVKINKLDSSEYNVSIPDKTLSEGATGIVTWIKADDINDWETIIPNLITYDDSDDSTFVNSKVDDRHIEEIIPEKNSFQDSLDQVLAAKQILADSILLERKKEREIELKLQKNRELDSILNSVLKEEVQVQDTTLIDSIK